MSGLATLVCCLLLIVNWPETSSSNQLRKTWDTFEIALSLYAGIDAGTTIHDALKSKNTPMSNGERMILSQLSALSQDINAARNAILYKISDQLHSKLSENLKNLFTEAADVDFVFKRYLLIYGSLRNRTENELKDFSLANTLHQSNLFKGLERSLFRMHELLIRGDDTVESTLFIITKESSQLGELCSKKESPQQLIKELYDLVVNTHLKGLTIRKFSFSIRQEYEKQSFQLNMDDDFRLFKEQVNKTYNAVKAAMEVAPRALFNCDPPKWELGKNYEQLGPVLQTHIVVTSDINDSGKCDTKKEKHQYISEHSRYLEVSKRCEQGHMRQCENFVQDFEVCYSAKTSPRLYDWAKATSDDVYGFKNVTSCSNKTMELSLNYVQKAFSNTNCLCICDSGRRSEDRYFSVQPVVSDYSNNKVVTGAQIVKEGRVFYIKIQEGTLGPNNTIIDQPVWKEVPENYVKDHWKSISKVATSTTRSSIRGRENSGDISNKYVYNTIFHKNSILHPVTYDWSKVNLDEYNLKPNEVITGLRFNTNGNALVLQVQATAYDLKTGELGQTGTNNVESDNYWTTSSSEARQEILLREPEVPTAVDRRSELEIYSSGRYVRFRPTDNRKDLGQNTVPFIDTQPITTNPPMPLSGAGLIYKRKGLSGGFLALKLIHPDLLL